MIIELENLKYHFPLTEDEMGIEMLFEDLIQDKDFKNLCKDFEVNILDFLDVKVFDNLVEKCFEGEEEHPKTVELKRHNLNIKLYYENEK